MTHKLGVVIDTYANETGSSNNRIGVNLDGNTRESFPLPPPIARCVGSFPIASPNLSQGTHSLGIRFLVPPADAPTSVLMGTLIITLDGNDIGKVDRLELPSLTNTTTAYIGFTAATGTHVENHDILHWSYRAL